MRDYKCRKALEIGDKIFVPSKNKLAARPGYGVITDILTPNSQGGMFNTGYRIVQYAYGAGLLALTDASDWPGCTNVVHINEIRRASEEEIAANQVS